MTLKRPNKSALGRGLSALISTPPVQIEVSDVKASTVRGLRPVSDPVDEDGATQKERISSLPIDLIQPNPAQPRKRFTDAELKELADSIKNLGILQPVIVRTAGGGKYEIVAGERRWRAARIAGLTDVPAIVKELSDWESLEIALVENVQRQNLNPIDEAEAYQSLMDQFSLSQSDVAERIGKERATVANYLRLLKLDPSVREMVREERLSTGHAKALLSLKEPAAQLHVAKKTLEDGLSVRALEALVGKTLVFEGDTKPVMKGKGVGISGTRSTPSAFPELVDRLRKTLATKVIIRHQPSGRGKLEIEYFSEEELDRVAQVILGE